MDPMDRDGELPRAEIQRGCTRLLWCGDGSFPDARRSVSSVGEEFQPCAPSSWFHCTATSPMALVSIRTPVLCLRAILLVGAGVTSLEIPHHAHAGTALNPAPCSFRTGFPSSPTPDRCRGLRPKGSWRAWIMRWRWARLVPRWVEADRRSSLRGVESNN